MTTQDNSKIYYQNANMSVNNQQKPNLTIYPNPASDFLYIENIPKPMEMEIYDLSGKVMLRKEVNNSSESVNVSQLSKGVYFYGLNQNGKTIKTGRLIKN